MAQFIFQFEESKYIVIGKSIFDVFKADAIRLPDSRLLSGDVQRNPPFKVRDQIASEALEIVEAVIYDPLDLEVDRRGEFLLSIPSKKVEITVWRALIWSFTIKSLPEDADADEDLVIAIEMFRREGRTERIRLKAIDTLYARKKEKRNAARRAKRRLQKPSA